MELSNSYRPEELVLRCQPFVHVLNFTEKGIRCDYCFKLLKNNALYMCNKCKWMYYCSKKCQNDDLEQYHQSGECDIQEKLISNSLETLKFNTPRLILRLYFTLTAHPHLYYRPYPTNKSNETRCFAQFEDHCEEIRKDEVRMKFYYLIRNQLDKCHYEYNEEILFEYFCKTFINAFTIYTSSNVTIKNREKTINSNCNDKQHINGNFSGLMDIGRAIYIAASKFDHSCMPNTKYSFDGLNIEFRATRRITSNTPVIISYLSDNSLSANHVRRRNQLLKRYYFLCECELCKIQSGRGKQLSMALIPFGFIEKLRALVNI